MVERTGFERAGLSRIRLGRGREDCVRGGRYEEKRMRVSGAIVIGGDYRALGIVRSLGRRGIPVWVLTNEHRVATASRYARFDGDWPKQPAQQIRYLLKLCDLHRLDGWALFPTDDEASAVLAQHHAVLSKRFLMTTPPWDVLRWSYDKRLTHRLASETGVAQPRTFMPKNRHEVVRLECGFPAILKPAFKPELNRFTLENGWRVQASRHQRARVGLAYAGPANRHRFSIPDVAAGAWRIDSGDSDSNPSALDPRAHGSACRGGRNP